MSHPFGIDVSQWNNVTSWQQAKTDGVELGICKATEGLDFVDPTFQDNWRGSSVLTARIAYHFGHPKNDPTQEATHYLSVATCGADDWPMLDMETTDGSSFAHAGDWSLAWCQYVKDRTGKAPFFYTYRAFIDSMGGSAQPLTAFPLYEAAYQCTPPDPAPWAKWSIWQSTDRGRVPGVYGDVDIDQLAPGTLALLAPAVPAPQGGPVNLSKPASGIIVTPTGKGYWIVAQDGGVFAYGDANPNLGSAVGRSSQPVVGGACTPDGNGLWLVAADGGVFALGAAPFLGSMGGHQLNALVVGIAASPDGKGYALVAADGGAFSFGDVPFVGAA